MNVTAKVQLETNMGNILIELYGEDAPITVENFLNYVKDGFYDGTIFHRVIPNFMIQGGGMLEDMSQKANNDPIKNEADNGLKNDYATLAMARTNVPDSATSQFFINVKDNDFLNFSSKTPQGWGYAVFGKVVEGLDVVKQIEGVRTGNHGAYADVPTQSVIIKKASIV